MNMAFRDLVHERLMAFVIIFTWKKRGACGRVTVVYEQCKDPAKDWPSKPQS